MPADKKRSPDYQSLRSPAENNGSNSSLRPPAAALTLSPAKQKGAKEIEAPKNLSNPKSANSNLEKRDDELSRKTSSEAFSENSANKEQSPENSFAAEEAPEQPETNVSFAEAEKQKRHEKKDKKDSKLLNRETWLARSNHGLTYAGIFLFTLVVYFRPYELIGALSGLNSLALITAVATVLIYLPSQITGEGSLITFTTEVKCLLFIAFWALLTAPVAIDPSLAWNTFNDTFSKVLIIFIVMVSSVRTAARIKGLVWLALGAGVMVSGQALYLYQQGVFKTEGYRVNIDSGGMFGNPNDMALYLIMYVPLAVALGLATKNWLARLLYFAVTLLMIGCVVVTQSRGGFLGLLAVGAVLVWKLGKNQRFKAVLIAAVAGLIFILLAPGNYGLRIVSIFIPSLDPVGSADQRSELLKLSLLVTARHPFGIGMGNFPIVSIHNLQTHNAYTQVSSELGWLAVAAYVFFMVSPWRKLAAIERRLFASDDREDNWIYYLSVGVQASIAGYIIASFFAPTAYNWYVYYPVAYAVCLRRIYQIRQAESEVGLKAENGRFDFQNASPRLLK